MGLYEEYFKAIKEDKKIVEVRLNDEKRQKIKEGDTIEFIKIPEKNETIQVKVAGLKSYDTFKSMYEEIPFKAFDCDGWTMNEMLDGTYDIYTPEQEKEWGALAISITYLS